MNLETKNGYRYEIDDEDFEKTIGYWWYGWSNKHTRINGNKVIYSKYILGEINKNGKRTCIRLHRLIMNASRNMQVDHIDGNGLNNKKSNLRLCNGSQNQANRMKRCDNTSGFKGVTWYKPLNKWRSQIMVNRRYKTIGYFDSLKVAAENYNMAAKKYFGEFAKLNEITPPHPNSLLMDSNADSV